MSSSAVLAQVFDIRRLRYFQAVAQQGSISAASRSMNVSQSAVSHHMSEIERVLGVKVFERRAQGVRLTQTGKLLMSHADVILSHVTIAEGELLERFGNLNATRTVTLMMNPSLASTLTPLVLSAAAKELPWITLRIRETLIGECHDAIEQGRADLGIVNTEGLEGEWDVLFEEPLMLVTNKPPAEATITFSRFCEVPLVIPSRAKSIRRVLEAHAERMGRRLNIVSEIDGIVPRKEAVLAGLGSTVANWPSVCRECRAGTLFRQAIVEPELRRNVVLLARRGFEGRAKKELRALIGNSLRQAYEDA